MVLENDRSGERTARRQGAAAPGPRPPQQAMPPSAWTMSISASAPVDIAQRSGNVFLAATAWRTGAARSAATRDSSTSSSRPRNRRSRRTGRCSRRRSRASLPTGCGLWTSGRTRSPSRARGRALQAERIVLDRRVAPRSSSACSFVRRATDDYVRCMGTNQGDRGRGCARLGVIAHGMRESEW